MRLVENKLKAEMSAVEMFAEDQTSSDKNLATVPSKV